MEGQECNLLVAMQFEKEFLDKCTIFGPGAI